MSVRFEIVGADNLREELGRLPGTIRNVSRKAMQLAVGLVHRSAAALVPVRTGRLKNSLFWNADYERTGNTIVGAVGTNVHYAPHVEFGTHNEDGTVRMDARPYLRPALTNNANTINSIFASETGNALHG